MKRITPTGPHTHILDGYNEPRWLIDGVYYSAQGHRSGISPRDNCFYRPVISPTVTATQPGDWLASLTSAERKEVAVSRGLFAYFPDALALIARHSVRANAKHNPGQPVHWSREKSSDHEDCIGRHSLAVAVDENSMDDDAPHIVCRAWRALAALQLWAEKQKGAK
jgi:hypothetical protein